MTEPRSVAAALVAPGLPGMSGAAPAQQDRPGSRTSRKASPPLLEAGASKKVAITLAAATGLVEPPAALLGYGAAEISAAVLLLGLAFAAGAMVYVVLDELVPESHASGFERLATFGAVGGFAVMMALDNAFG